MVPVRRARFWLLWLWPKETMAMTLVRVIYVRPDVPDLSHPKLGRLIAHELVHVRQWHTDGVVGFLRHYLGDYARHRRKRLSHKEAYRAISYEAEAYGVEEWL